MQASPHPPPDLVAHIYDAAGDSTLWGDVLERVQQFVRADSSVLYLDDTRARAASFEVRRDLDPDVLRTFYEYYFGVDPNHAYRLTRPVGTVTASHRILPDSELARTEYYNDFLRPLGRFYTLGGQIFREGNRHGVFALQRRRRAGPFSELALRRVRGLFPHLRRAFVIGRQLGAAVVERQAMLAALECLPAGMLLLDERGQVAVVNRRAESMLAAGDGLVLTATGVTCLAVSLQPALERLVRDAVATGAGLGNGSGGAMLIPASATSEGYQLVVTPLRTERLRLDVGRHRICAAVFVQRRGAGTQLSPDILRDLFGLTTAEARVATALVNGRRPDQIAEEAGTSWHTVRAQLSAVYEKLGVHRQSQAVQRLMSSPAVLAPPVDESQ